MSTFGEELRRERELRSISLREIAEATKVNVRYLEAIERNQFEQLPGGVFNRGFVRAYAQFIGVDPEAMVNAYLLEEQSKAKPGGGASALSRDTVLRGGRDRRAPARPRRAARKEPAPEPGASADGPRKRARWGLGVVLFVLVVATLVLLGIWASGVRL